MQRVVFFFNALFFTVSGFGIILELGIRSLLDKRRRQSNVAPAHSTAAELRGITICDKKLHNELLYATPSVWGNPTMICAGGNAGV